MTVRTREQERKKSWDRDGVSDRDGKGELQMHRADGCHDETLTPLTAQDGKFDKYI